MVGWSVRLATRSSHSAADRSKWTHTASRGWKASSRKALRSSDLSLHLSRMTRLSASFASRPTAPSTAFRPAISSWQTRTQPWPDFSSCFAKVLFPLPGRPTNSTSPGRLVLGRHAGAGDEGLEAAWASEDSLAAPAPAPAPAAATSAAATAHAGAAGAEEDDEGALPNLESSWSRAASPGQRSRPLNSSALASSRFPRNLSARARPSQPRSKSGRRAAARR
mmetsp:Transcript_10830/g.32619  ORF Transcript_10830/g.32619 Transcript_10830/m.32619 type:complete len:222 (+) Transcript_10830:1140-1805(+)